MVSGQGWSALQKRVFMPRHPTPRSRLAVDFAAMQFTLEDEEAADPDPRFKRR
jgi:hypothetical protein